MEIDVTLGGALIEHLPQGRTGNRFTLRIYEPSTLAGVLATLQVSADQRLLAILNGNVVQPEAFASTEIQDCDQLALMPPIVAG